MTMKFVDDPTLKKLRAELDKVEARLSERRDDGVTEANFIDWNVKYMEMTRLEEQRVDLNRRYQQRRVELQGRSLIFGRYIEHDTSRDRARGV